MTDITETETSKKDNPPEDRRHPVVEYLESLVWDGVPRIDRWLIDYAEAEDTAQSRAAGRMILVGAVRRARRPGCRFDQLPVIVAPQGSGKSAALRLLAVEDAWFGDDLPIGEDTRQILEATSGKWIIEMSELELLLEKEADDAEDLEAAPGRPRGFLKMFLSRTHDEARLAYQREVSRVPRSFVIVGTTSTPDYLVAATGNRRIVPVHVRLFDLDRLRAVRDQLWAEAAAVEASGIQLEAVATA